MKISKSQIDQLGNRLRQSSLSDADLKILDDYRKSFSEAYEEVVRKIREKLKLEPTGRPAKSTTAIVEKLHRESIRLSQMQDIAGCRIVVRDIQKQDSVVKKLREIFTSASVMDRRVKPSHGYRAVHIIINNLNKAIEVQIRTELQHGWSEFSEKLSDKIDPAIKYGGGSKETQKMLYGISILINNYEGIEINIQDKKSRKRLSSLRKEIANLIKQHSKLF